VMNRCIRQLLAIRNCSSKLAFYSSVTPTFCSLLLNNRGLVLNGHFKFIAAECLVKTEIFMGFPPNVIRRKDCVSH
jgi:hypothetical protein